MSGRPVGLTVGGGVGGHGGEGGEGDVGGREGGGVAVVEVEGGVGGELGNTEELLAGGAVDSETTQAGEVGLQEETGEVRGGGGRAVWEGGGGWG